MLVLQRKDRCAAFSSHIYSADSLELYLLLTSPSPQTLLEPTPSTVGLTGKDGDTGGGGGGSVGRYMLREDNVVTKQCADDKMCTFSQDP
jgi:hypothetical protein